MKQAFKKIIVVLLSIQLGIPGTLLARETTISPVAEPSLSLATMEAAINLADQQAVPTSEEEAQRKSELKKSRKQALEVFKSVTKMADKVITHARVYTEYKTHTGETFPVSHVFGEFGHTMTKNEKIEIGRKLLEGRQDFIFFTLKSRLKEAQDFKAQFEAEENADKESSQHKKVLIVEIPDRYEELLMKDSGLAKKTISDYLPSLPTNPLNGNSQSNFPTLNIIKNNFTATIDSSINKTAQKWGVFTAGTYSAVFFVNGYLSGNHGWQLPVAMLTYAAAMSWFYTGQADRIRNIFQANILRDFRVVGNIRRAVEQLPLSFATAYGAFFLGHTVAPMTAPGTIGQVLGNTVLSIAGIFTNNARQDNLSRKASLQFLEYSNWINLTLNALMVAGVVGFTHDLVLMEITAASLTKTALLLGLTLGLYKSKERFEKVLMARIALREAEEKEKKERLVKVAKKKEERKAKIDRIKKEVEERRLRVVAAYGDQKIDYGSLASSLNAPRIRDGRPLIEPRFNLQNRSILTCSQLFAR